CCACAALFRHDAGTVRPEQCLDSALVTRPTRTIAAPVGVLQLSEMNQLAEAATEPVTAARVAHGVGSHEGAEHQSRRLPAAGGRGAIRLVVNPDVPRLPWRILRTARPTSVG